MTVALVHQKVGFDHKDTLHVEDATVGNIQGIVGLGHGDEGIGGHVVAAAAQGQQTEDRKGECENFFHGKVSF